MKRLIVSLLLILLMSPLFSLEMEPALFGLKWGSSLTSVKAALVNNNLNLDRLKYYSIRPGRDQVVDLKSQAFLKYSTKGTPLYDEIATDVIFTFYNSDGTLEGLKLSKIELYLKNRDKKGLFVNVRSIYKNQLSKFCEDYKVSLKTGEERFAVSRYDYEVTVNGIYVNFVANTGDNRLDKEEALFISYENSSLQNLMLKRELELQLEKNRLLGDNR